MTFDTKSIAEIACENDLCDGVQKKRKSLSKLAVAEAFAQLCDTGFAEVLTLCDCQSVIQWSQSIRFGQH